jgi:hypothetical protein
MKEIWMNTSLKRIAVAAALLTVLAASGCASMENVHFGPAAPSQQKLPGDSLGYLAEPAASVQVG